MAKALTPLEFVCQPRLDRSASALLVTARGGNRDIAAALEKSAGLATAVVCASTGSELVRSARCAVHAADPPSGRDGFLATNSLLASMVWLSRAYIGALGLPFELPRFAELSSGPGPLREARGCGHAVVLHGCWGGAAAADAESKMSEAGLAGVQACDYRSFGHGRHNWLDKAPGRTCVVALLTPQCSRLAERTLELLPGDVPVVRLSTDHDGPAGAVDLTVQVFRMVAAFGEARGIDPGRPAVKEYGRRLYELGMQAGEAPAG